MREVYGFPLSLQQLTHDGDLLEDGAGLDAPMDLQLVLLTISGLSARDRTARFAELELAYASRRNCEKVARYLLEAGVGADRRDVDGKTFLMLASRNGSLDVACLLLEAGAEKDLEDDGGHTALMFASWYGHGGVVRALLEARADTNHIDNQCQTALMFASTTGHVKIARLLLEARAETYCQDISA